MMDGNDGNVMFPMKRRDDGKIKNLRNANQNSKCRLKSKYWAKIQCRNFGQKSTFLSNI